MFASDPEASCPYCTPTLDHPEMAAVKNYDKIFRSAYNIKSLLLIFGMGFFAMDVLQVFSFCHLNLLSLICSVIVATMAETQLRNIEPK